MGKISIGPIFWIMDNLSYHHQSCYFVLIIGNISPPNQDWLAKSVTHESGLLEEAAVLEALRVPGNRVIIGENIALLGFNSASGSWALRWPSNKHPKSDLPVSEIIYFHSEDKFNENELYEWCKEVTELTELRKYW